MLWLKYLLLAALAAGLLLAASVGALYLTSTPRFVALALEPISLFLLPGLVVAMAVAGPHDLEASTVLEASAVFYVAVFWLWFRWRGRAARQAGSRSR